MKTTLIIARHGNTFDPNENPRRIGARTDLPLVASGRIQAESLGRHLREKGLEPSIIYCSFLKRATETAALAFPDKPHYPLSALNEIDYGPDENALEKSVIARIGSNALKAWDEQATMPEGWNPRPQEIIENWKKLAAIVLYEHRGQTILAVTSNGTARFAPHLTGDFESFRKRFGLKLSTGAYGILEHDGKAWHVIDWNVKPTE